MSYFHRQQTLNVDGEKYSRGASITLGKDSNASIMQYRQNNGNIEIRQTTNLKINNNKYNCEKITELSDHNAVVLTLYI